MVRRRNSFISAAAERELRREGEKRPFLEGSGPSMLGKRWSSLFSYHNTDQRSLAFLANPKFGCRTRNCFQSMECENMRNKGGHCFRK